MKGSEYSEGVHTVAFGVIRIKTESSSVCVSGSKAATKVVIRRVNCEAGLEYEIGLES